jgi:FdhE protein
LPPLRAKVFPRAPVWRAGLRHILAALAPNVLPQAARVVIERLKNTDDPGLERLADTLLAEDDPEFDRAAAPFVAAALQVYWLHMATSLGLEAFGRLEAPYLCPVCGAAPVASVVRLGGAHDGLRYLHCSLCSAEWHAVRIKCVFCESTKGISYYGIEGGNGAIKAERCEGCESYLKILYMEKDLNVDAVADDVASIALDILMADSGVVRNGVNFFLLGGDA